MSRIFVLISLQFQEFNAAINLLTCFYLRSMFEIFPQIPEICGLAVYLAAIRLYDHCQHGRNMSDKSKLLSEKICLHKINACNHIKIEQKFQESHFMNVERVSVKWYKMIVMYNEHLMKIVQISLLFNTTQLLY